MNFFYLNKEIENLELRKFTGLKKFSELLIQKTSLLNMIQDNLNTNFHFQEISNINEIQTSEKEIIIWTSNIIYRDKVMQDLFCRKLLYSYFGIFYGSKRDFIFKGKNHELKSILNTNKKVNDHKRIIKINSEDNLITINTLWDLKKLSHNKLHSRYFNDLKVNQDTITKESINKEKIIGEFSFLDSLPKEIQKYYVPVSNLKIEAKKAHYTMKKIDGIDLSMQYINKGFSIDSMQNIFDELEVYFQLITKFQGVADESAYKFIISKNNTRLEELESWEGFDKLNTFINNHTHFSGIRNLFDKSNELMQKNKAFLDTSGGTLSHGDLCFGNILMNEDECKLIFIDPRGGKIDDSYRTPYYDLAKLCHSLLGGYDHIINNVAEIKFNQSMQACIIFNQDLLKYEKLFKLFIENLGFKYNLVRIIEISLFLSMLPLHIESIKKVNMLALRASELILLAEN